MQIVLTTIIWAAILQGFLLGFIFIFSKKHGSFSNRLLGTFLITFIFGASSDLLPFNNIGSYSIMRYFTIPEVKLLFPVLFLHYVLEKIGSSKNYRLLLRANYVLAFAVIGITLFNIALFLFSGKSIYDVYTFDQIDRFFMLHQYYAFLLTVAALVISVLETIKYRNLAKNEYSDITLISINWLWQFIFVFIPVAILWAIELIRILTGGEGQSEIVVAIWAIVAVIIYMVSFNAFIHQDLFLVSSKSYLNNKIKVKEKDNSAMSVCDAVKESMENEKYYLNQDLSIHDFAREINVSARTISTCINKNFGYNFNEWVNNYRVDKALSILSDKSSNHLSIEGIGSDSGFKSRSAMYIAFKKKTGKTPGCFRTN